MINTTEAKPSIPDRLRNWIAPVVHKIGNFVNSIDDLEIQQPKPIDIVIPLAIAGLGIAAAIGTHQIAEQTYIANGDLLNQIVRDPFYREHGITYDLFYATWNQLTSIAHAAENIRDASIVTSITSSGVAAIEITRRINQHETHIIDMQPVRDFGTRMTKWNQAQ